MADVSAPPPQQPARRPRERQAGAQLDLADRLVALQRKSAGPPTRRADRSPATAAAASGPQQSSTQPHPPPTISRPTRPVSPPPPQPQASSSKRRAHLPPRDESPDEYSRSSHMLTAPRGQGKLFNPNTDPIPTRHMHRDIDVESDNSSAVGQPTRPMRRRIPQPQPSSQALQASSPPLPQQVPRQLFDPRRDDPVRFAVLTRAAPPPKPPSGPPSGGYISASATSASDAQSMGSNFTLTSGTTSSSASNPYSPANTKELGGNRLWLEQMKRMYRQITDLEKKILSEGDVVDDDDGMGSRNAAVSTQPSKGSDEKWARLVQEHKRLTELCHDFLSFALKPQVPASLQTLASKYNIPARLWNHGFQRLLAALRRASMFSPAALEQLQSFIIYSYGFYTSLMEEEDLAQFRVLWLEALGDLSRYQMTVAAHLAENASKAGSSTAGPLSLPPPSSLPASNSPGVSRMEGSQQQSIGAHAAAEFELEDDRELWRRNAREWYTKGIKDMPGQGRLHHHLGLVSTDVDTEELRAVYHFAKSLVANHPCDAARESILPLFSVEKQSARYQPSTTAPSIFLLMHGMLFTRIQLDDFEPSIARFKERLQLYASEVTEADWTMMAVLNICALLEYGRPEGVLRKICGLGAQSTHGHAASRPGSSRAPRPEAKRADSIGDQMQIDSVVEADPEEVRDDRMVDASAALSGPMEALSTANGMSGQTETLPHTLQLTLRLTFELLLYTIDTPFIPSPSPFRPSSLNPYLTTVLTFLATIFRYEPAVALIERHVPWAKLLPFFSQIARHTSSAPEQDQGKGSSRWFGSSPLPEDWCLRGSEWVRRVYERGFWRTKDGGITTEMDVIVPPVAPVDDMSDGMLESETEGNIDWRDARYRRLRWSAEVMVKSVKGLEWVGESRERMAVMAPPLSMKVELWEAEKRREEEAERQRMERSYARVDDESMDVDDEVDDEEDDDDLEDTEEVRALKARRRYLRNLQSPSAPRPSRPAVRLSRKAKPTRPMLKVAAGYTILVCDTNILLSSLPIVSKLIETHRWTFVIPLAVVTELDGLSNNPSELGMAAREALSYVIASVQTHSASLKVQTSKGNYLHSLTIRSEETSLGPGDRNMDDLIVRSAMWQLDHFVDRSELLKSTGREAKRTDKASKVALLTFDRNMRLKARSRKLDAADERDMAAIFSSS